MEIAGYIASVLIGLSLGLIGGGGSILTVPVLVYLFGVAPAAATSYSLFIVGSTALIGAWRSYRLGNIHLKTVLLFGTTSVATVFITRKLIIPAIPEHIAYAGSFELTHSILTMLLFAVLMILASVSMIRTGSDQGKKGPQSVVVLLLYGIAIGLVTGFLGAGGGFLLIPALVFFAGLDMKAAIGTSLAIIALNSLVGFSGDIGHIVLDWVLLITVSALAIAGLFAGMRIGKNIDGRKLKKGFGWFVLITGIYILIKELV